METEYPIGSLVFESEKTKKLFSPIRKNQKIMKYLQILCNNAKEIANSKNYKYKGNHKFSIETLITGYKKSFDDNECDELTVLTTTKIMHHNGKDIIDVFEADMNWENKDKPISLQYWTNGEMQYYGSGKWWKMTDMEMNWEWLEDRMKMAAVEMV